MTSRNTWSRGSVGTAAMAARVPDGVVRTAELRRRGVSSSSIETRCRPGGPWQRLLPGVLLLCNGAPSRRQMLLGALAYAGHDAVVTGLDALRALGLATPAPDAVHLLLPSCRRVNNHGFVLIERTTRLPAPVHADALPCAPVPRAVLDAARRERDPARLRPLLVEPLRQAACTVQDLWRELDAGSQRGTAAPRSLLRALRDDVHQPRTGEPGTWCAAAHSPSRGGTCRYRTTGGGCSAWQTRGGTTWGWCGRCADRARARGAGAA